MSTTDVVVPGDTITLNPAQSIGVGMHLLNKSTAHASLAGKLGTTSTATSAKSPTSRDILTSSSNSSSTSPRTQSLVPSVGDTILGRVTRTNPRQATLDILALTPTGTDVLSEPFQALIRQQDIRATEIDKVKVSESFRVGDIVRGIVISLGDERNYYVSTAKNEFGVVLAKSESGHNQMVPISWREMRDMDLGVNELRKVAKVI